MRDRARFIGFAPAEEQCARKRVRKQVFSGVLMAPAHPLAATAERPRCLDSPPLTTTALDTLPAGERARPHSATRQSGLLTAVSAPAKTLARHTLTPESRSRGGSETQTSNPKTDRRRASPGTTERGRLCLCVRPPTPGRPGSASAA